MVRGLFEAWLRSLSQVYLHLTVFPSGFQCPFSAVGFLQPPCNHTACGLPAALLGELRHTLLHTVPHELLRYEGMPACCPCPCVPNSSPLKAEQSH